MRRLLLLRHSKAEEPPPGKQDRERVLTARGRNDARAIGTYLAKHDLIPDRALVSSAARTRETWDLAAQALAEEKERRVATTFDDRLYGAQARSILDVIAEVDGSAKTIVIVGHNPAMQELAISLVGTGDIEARQRLQDKFPTSGLAVIDFAGGDWKALKPKGGRLHLFVSPRMISAATD